MHEYGALPRAREDGLLEEAVGEELLIYDQGSHTAHCLSPIAASVWRHCDGEHDLKGLARLVAASEESVADALHELGEKDLLDCEPQLIQSTSSGISRREAIGRVARYGVAAAAGPMIVSATAATPAMASSGGGCGGGEGQVLTEPSEITTVKFKGKVSHVIRVKCISGEVEGPVEAFTQNESAFKVTKSTCGTPLKAGESCEVTIEHTNTTKGQSTNFDYNWKNGICPEKKQVLLESE
jgi:hypothetical protein